MNETGEDQGGLRGAVSGRAYIRTRPRGFAPWSPKPGTMVLVDQVQEVLREYRRYLPMTARQIFYRLVGAYAYPKDENAYARLIEMLNRARRARMIPMESIRDDRAESMGGGGGYTSTNEWWDGVRASARYYQRPLTEGQPRAVEVWVEAAGMMPMVSRVTSDYGVAVYCSGGFESVGAKYDAAARLARRDMPTVVLSVGDQDPSGLALVDAAAEDVAAFAAELGAEPPTVTRLAVTPEQVRAYALPTAPQKSTDRRGDHMHETVQAEALSPDQLSAIVRAGLESVVDLAALDAVRERSERERAALVAEMDRIRRA